jgi:ubiquinone/menaquinone biosynthesis C-methylase UbiE
MMAQTPDYVLGQSAEAARRLAIQDANLSEVSERLLDELTIRPEERVVELGCGAGSFSLRILRRLGPSGVLIAVDNSEGLLAQARQTLTDMGPARLELVRADIAQAGPWLEGASVVVARTVLHHVPMAELLLGQLRAALRPGTRLGFMEPDFRSPLARLAYLETSGRPELAPLAVWATAINQLYLANRLSPDVGATLARCLELAGYRHVRGDWAEGRPDSLMVENMLLFYEEVGDRLQALNILTATQIEEQQRLLRELPADQLVAPWGMFRATCEV